MASVESSKLVTDAQIPGIGDVIREWVAMHINVPGIRSGRDFGDCLPIGVVRNDNLVAGVIYNCWDRECQTIQVSMCAGQRMWATKPIVLAILAYAFDGLDVNRIWSRTESNNTLALRFNKRIGFVQEGVAADDFGPGRNAVGLRMLRKEFFALRRRWGYEQEGRRQHKRIGHSVGAIRGEQRGIVPDGAPIQSQHRQPIREHQLHA